MLHPLRAVRTIFRRTSRFQLPFRQFTTRRTTTHLTTSRTTITSLQRRFNNTTTESPNDPTSSSPPERIGFAPSIKHIRTWDQWDYAFSIASILQFAGFASMDILALRLFSAGSAGFFMVAHSGRKFFVGYFWALCYLVLNVIAIARLLAPTMTVQFSESELDMFEHSFLKHGITPREFKILLQNCEKQVFSRGAFITLQGEPVRRLYLIIQGDAVVYDEDVSTGQRHAITEIHVASEKECEFVGELSFVETDKADKIATASVICESEVTCLAWDERELHLLLTQNRVDLHKFHSVLTGSVREKIIHLNRERTEVELESLEFMCQLMRVTEKTVKGKDLQLSNDQSVLIHEYCEKYGIPKHKMEEVLERFGVDSMGKL